MNPVQAAMYRAEKDALRRRFDVNFRIYTDGQEFTEVASGEYEEEIEALDVEHFDVEVLEDEPQESEDIIEELGYDPAPEVKRKESKAVSFDEAKAKVEPEPEPEVKQLDPEVHIKQRLVNDGIVPDEETADDIVKDLDLENVEVDKALDLGKFYMAFLDMGANHKKAIQLVKSGQVPH